MPKKSIARIASSYVTAFFCILLISYPINSFAENIVNTDLTFPVKEWTRNKAPNYPDISLIMKETGTVYLKILVDTKGHPKDVVVEKSSGYTRLDKAATKAVNDWNFTPKFLNGAAVEDWVVIPFNFTLDKYDDARLHPYSWVDQNGCKLFDPYIPAGTKYEWDGACTDGFITGYGTLKKFIHGSLDGFYKGNFKQGTINGNGIAEYPNGARYHGNFINGLRWGLATYSWKNGVTYKGEFDKGFFPDRLYKQAEALNKTSAQYSLHKLRNGNNGIATLDAGIDENGKITDIRVSRSQHPAFEKASVRAMTDLEFKPATIKGKAVESRTLRTFEFNFESNNAGVYQYSYKSIPAGIPPVDLLVAPLVYPYELLRAGVKGFVKADVTVDKDGKASNIEIIESTNADFSGATQAMIASSTFFPALEGNKPKAGQFTIRQDFQPGTHNILFDEHTTRLLEHIRYQIGIYKLNELDNEPKALYNPLPFDISKKYLKNNKEEQVIVEFYIDKTGAVQLPHVINTNNEELGWLAVTAISRWQFTPPRIKGKPVDAIAKIPVTFPAQ